ncbi:hypothetical protein Tco_1332002 [Tanacetum coccineum]
MSPLTAVVDRWSGDGAETVITPRGTTHVVTRVILMIGVRGTVHRIAGTRFLEGYVACSHWWIQLAYEVWRQQGIKEDAEDHYQAEL